MFETIVVSRIANIPLAKFSWLCYIIYNGNSLKIPLNSVSFKFSVRLHGDKTYNSLIVLFVETPRKFITAKLSIRKPGSSSVLIICDLFNSHALG